MLLATVLLAAGLALAFATLSAATKTATRGEAMAERNEHIRAVESFLRKRLVATRPVPFGFDESTSLPQRFIGSAERMQFVADLPDYLGQGGPYLHDFAITDDAITLNLAMVQAGQLIEAKPPRPPEVLVEQLKEARFRYRGITAEQKLSEWLDEWKNVEQLPLMVEVTITDERGAWPPLVVTLPMAATTGSSIMGEGMAK